MSMVTIVLVLQGGSGGDGALAGLVFVLIIFASFCGNPQHKYNIMWLTELVFSLSIFIATVAFFLSLNSPSGLINTNIGSKMSGERTVIVIGGGLAGMSASIEVSRQWFVVGW